MSVIVVIPSRGRPERAGEAVAAAIGTAARPDTGIVLAVDADDPFLPGYRDLRWSGPIAPFLLVLPPEATGDLVRVTNTVSVRIAAEEPEAIIGNLGDDHMIRTAGWDRMVLDALARPGIAYGDDGIHGPNLPTAPFISAAFVRALGWYALPSCRHLFIDTAWRELGLLTGTLRYLPGLTIEHLHPLVGKAEWDEGYRQANSDETTAHDFAALEVWRAGPAADDAARCLAVL